MYTHESWLTYMAFLGYKIQTEANSAKELGEAFEFYGMGLFDSITEAEFKVNFRVQLIFSALEMYACGGPTRVTEKDGTDIKNALSVMISTGALGVIDNCLDASTYTDAWQMLVRVSIDAADAEPANAFVQQGGFLANALKKFLTPSAKVIRLSWAPTLRFG